MLESWMLARLRRETATCHAAADADRMAVMKDFVTAGDYRAFLTSIYGFEAPVAHALARTPELDTWIDMRGRSQLRLLRADLTALGMLDTAGLRTAAVVPFATPAEALGWLYVIEHNTLVHGLIERHLRRFIPDTIRIAGLYLGAQDRGSRRRELGEALDRCSRNLHDANRIVAGARAAFRAQHRWYAPTVERRVA
jgi:heme oxygenase